MLKALGCDVQGYHLSRPIPAELRHEWVASYDRPLAAVARPTLTA